MSSSSSSSSARATASISANEAEIRDLKAKRDRVESKRDLVENLLKVKEPQRPKFFENNPDYVGLESFTTAELKEKEKLLTQEISELSAEILSLRTPPGKYPIKSLFLDCVLLSIYGFPALFPLHGCVNLLSSDHVSRFSAVSCCSRAFARWCYRYHHR